jgi:hypothetical protein
MTIAEFEERVQFPHIPSARRNFNEYGAGAAIQRCNEAMAGG